MKIVFFSTRTLQKTYFCKLSKALINRHIDSHVINHKFLWLTHWCLTGFNLRQGTYSAILENCLKEKQNAPKHQHHSSFYWFIFKYLKTIEIKLLSNLYYTVLKKTQADSIVLWNGLKFRQSIIKNCADALNIPCIYMENGLIPNMTTVDAKGINFLNSVPRTADFFLARSCLNKTFQQEENSMKRPKELPKKYIFVPFQVNTDTQMTLFSPWIKNTRELVDVFCQIHKQLGDAMPDIIFKPHPQSDEDIPSLTKQLANMHKLTIMTTLPTDTLIQHSDAVVTINSTVGIEAIIARKKVIVLGEAFYQIKQLTMSANGINELMATLQHYVDWPFNKPLATAFLDYLQEDYQIKGSWREASPEHIARTCDRLIYLTQESTTSS